MSSHQALAVDSHDLPAAQQRPALAASRPDAMAIVFASYLIIVVAKSAPVATLDVQITDRFGSQQALTDVSPIEVLLDDGPALLGISLPLQHILPVGVHAGKVQVDISGSEGVVFRGLLDVHGLEVSRGLDPVVVRILSTLVHAGMIDHRLAMIFDRSTRWLGPQALGGYEFEAVYHSPFGALVDGWIENVARRDLLLMSGDLTSMTSVGECITFARPEIDHALRQSPTGRSTGLLHGLLAPLIGCGEGNRSVYVLERYPEGGVIVGPITYEPVADRGKALEAALTRVISTPAVSGDQARAVLRLFLAAPNVELHCRVQRFGPEGVRPKLSVVVPLSGDPLFVRSLITQQEQFPVDTEWLLALQTSSGSSDIVRQLACGQAELKQAFVVVEIDVDGTMPQILNFATDQARGDYLLFLDEASWVDDDQPIVRALKDLENGFHEVLGLAMLLDDGSVDHLGLALRRDRFHRNRAVIEPVGRGFDAGKKARRGIQDDIEGVSVASMMVSRRVFHQIGGFDEDLFTPDAFGLDFCLRVRSAGGRVGLVRNTSLSRGLKDHSLIGFSREARKALVFLDGFTLADRYLVGRPAQRQLEGVGGRAR